MARFLSWSLVLALLGVFAAVVGELLRERRAAGRGMPAHSVYSEASDGLGEAAHLLGQLGWTPVALTRPVQTSRHRGLLVLVEPARPGLLAGEGGGMQAAEAETLLRWVGRGNTLLVFARKNTPLHQALGVVVTDEARPTDTFTTVTFVSAEPYRQGVAGLSVGSRATLRGPAGARVLWQVGGKPGALLLTRGKGRVLLVADPGLVTRHGLVRDDGAPRDEGGPAVFFINVVAEHARDSRVYFDEYHHGIRSSGGFWTYLAYHGERWTLLPLLAVLLAAGWRAAVRLGPAVPRPRPSAADGVAYASALGRLYQRAGARRLLARALVRGFLGALTRHLRLRRQALPAVVLAAWRQQHGRTAPAGSRDLDPATARLQTLLRGVNDLRRGDVGERPLLTWTRAFDQFREELEEAGGARKVPARHS
jgi:hypothetical protein